MRAVIAGSDEDGLGRALESEGVELTTIDGVASRPALEDAAIIDADLFVLMDVGQATAIAVAKDLNPEVRVVVYDENSIPEFARSQADLILDPDLLDAATVAEELAA